MSEVISIYRLLIKASAFYWAFIIISMILFLTLILVLIFIDYRINKKKESSSLLNKYALFFINDVFWVFMIPLFSTYLSIFKCAEIGNANVHFVDDSLECYSSLHLFICFILIVFLVFYIALGILRILYFCET